jgi:hypothetical protein
VNFEENYEGATGGREGVTAAMSWHLFSPRELTSRQRREHAEFRFSTAVSPELWHFAALGASLQRALPAPRSSANVQARSLFRGGRHGTHIQTRTLITNRHRGPTGATEVPASALARVVLCISSYVGRRYHALRESAVGARSYTVEGSFAIAFASTFNGYPSP